MAKHAINIDKKELQKILSAIEAEGQLNNRSAIFAEAAERFNKTHPNLGCTGAVVYLRVNQWKLELKTPKGKKGEGLKRAREMRKQGITPPPKAPSTPKQPKAPRSDTPVLLSETQVNAKLEERYKDNPKMLNLANRVAKGSRTAAIKMKCLDCCCENIEPIRHCTVYSCPLWSFRPFQKGVETEEE